MTQLKKLELAKESALTRIDKDDFIQVAPYTFMSLETVPLGDGKEEEVWVELSFKAKKKFDIDEAVSDYNFLKDSKNSV